MVRKGKKESATPTKDTFDPLAIEGKTPATVVLLLSSPEEDILIKACETIHAFADRGDENKLSLLGLGALKPLCQLITHSNKLVRRFAFMALGVMSTHSEVKNALKNLNIIPSIIEKLSPHEETVVHEFGTLCLASLSVDFVSKAVIFSNNGLPPVIQLLSSPDPDVVKNSLEIIFNQIQDYPSRSAIHELGGIPHLLAQLKSEFPVIQQLALKILQNITIDKDTRVTFREEQGFEKLIDVLKNKDLQDLHAASLHVVVNCLNDSECFQLIHKGGGLAQLMEFILSPTLPEIQANAVKCVARVAQSSENCNILHKQNVEKILVELLSVNDDRVKGATSQAVSAMSTNLASKEVLRELGAISALVELLSSETSSVKRDASRALYDLTQNNLHNVMAVYEAGGHEPLVRLLTEECPETVANSAATLSNMAGQEDIRYSILSQNALPALVEPLKSKDSHVQISTALCVATLACDTASRTEFKNAGGLPPLVNLLDSKYKDVQKMGSLAVKACACDGPCAVEMCVLGALEKLQKINQSESQKTVFSEMAMMSLLNSNLPVKYSLMGFLSPTDHVKDGFYDAGKAVAGQRVLSLEEHYCQPVNRQRAIIVINTAKHSAEETVVCTEEKQHHLSGTDIHSVKRETPRLGRKKEEEKPKDKDLPCAVSQSPPQRHSKMLNDPALEALVQEAKETVLLLDEAMTQYSILARMVSKAMGGEVDRKKMHTFEWTLHISELKFELQSNVVPIGMIKQGTYYHRALLFKCLADCIGLSCSLVRGEYNRGWNEVLVLNGQTQRYVVDLMHNPGSLLKVNTPAAEQYQNI
ncbi:armadillo repeat-containing protein 3 [Periophthalmus magnuspinnatus]|uniref:armadillo repeat-containing protein 3 n=1 Tax=Periophthalmus magnuspinnatus TaxID=409849 RepID=UPI00243718AD|nr:armadillo repeat-containing protein 3 [Periophthalmus magnuspinnatus]